MQRETGEQGGEGHKARPEMLRDELYRADEVKAQGSDLMLSAVGRD